ncbi:hypothetical protein NDU88_011861 [Pleurodeles waltl]|uniref:Uncharacterized protein n=1 Tax=Pleurodeles waltl TaxID=8319 RepID=A0AAV7QZZ8_PLEWA|nr:hypothetical protein NDU88_011861 [Pleurodeles waltl]
MFENGHLAEPFRPVAGPGPGREELWSCVSPLEDQPGARGEQRHPESPLDRGSSDPILPPAAPMTAGSYAWMRSRVLV